jgi:hypothetical protein
MAIEIESEKPDDGKTTAIAEVRCGKHRTTAFLYDTEEDDGELEDP